ncbi:hypothetical protein NC651_023672 [Populus alba x Populus x berolinensis]|nr:hypothetical protein NC651_023672 [Populus alba x Populus x berolinensis]
MKAGCIYNERKIQVAKYKMDDFQQNTIVTQPCTRCFGCVLQGQPTSNNFHSDQCNSHQLPRSGQMSLHESTSCRPFLTFNHRAPCVKAAHVRNCSWLLTVFFSYKKRRRRS